MFLCPLLRVFEDWSLLCHYDWVCRLLKYSGSKELWGPLAPDNCEDKGPDCGSALTLQIVKMFGALHAEHSDTRDRSMVANYCWCDRLSLKSFTHAATICVGPKVLDTSGVLTPCSHCPPMWLGDIRRLHDATLDSPHGDDT